ncbi:YwqH-like family protein [Oceanobacillus halophilus]|uniref:DUF5082 domain-containing protein n=1 Tax=Oceanobacillus halophilus TaxID=930130 RepID=A0A495A5C6_9BACI|nr:DUF5082 family protein [Oceanobacillus halophilus]RKQ34723.1 DUF5082 domain-containing protein [Oceanobacillus halophilus]
MASLFFINSQINSIHYSIHVMNQRLEQKRNDLQRLNTASTQLSNCKSEFINQKDLCLKPELMANSWHGQLANNFDTYRQSELQVSYLTLPNEQLANTISQLEDKISEIRAEIESLQSGIASHNSRLHSLYDQRREELSRSE